MATGLPDRPTLHLTERRDRGTQKAKRFKRHFPQTVEENESLALEQPAEAVQVTEPSAGPQNAAPNTSSARSPEGPEPHSASNTLLPPLGEARALLIGVRNCERPNFVELPGAHTDVDEWYDLLIGKSTFFIIAYHLLTYVYMDRPRLGARSYYRDERSPRRCMG
jgi:hypothetical protein